MRCQRFFISPEFIDRQQGLVRIYDPAVINQIRNVLRLKRGDQVIILDGQGGMYRCCLDKPAATGVEARIIDEHQAMDDPRVAVTVALPPLRGGRFEWALQKLTELGVARVVPIVSARSVVKPQSRSPGVETSKLTRWQAIMREAAEQCERASIPEVRQTMSLSSFVNSELWAPESAEHVSVACAERREAPLLAHLLRQLSAAEQPLKSMSVLVGPEGGLADQEIELASDSGGLLVSLGGRILRSETAAIYALAQITFTFGDG